MFKEKRKVYDVYICKTSIYGTMSDWPGILSHILFNIIVFDLDNL